MATIQGYTKTGVDRKMQARSPVTLPYAGTGTPELAAFPDAKTGDVIEREGDRARWRVVANQIVPIAGGVTSVNGMVGSVNLTPADLGAAAKSYVDTELGKRALSSHTHTKADITDLEIISTAATANHIVKRTTSGNITVPTTPNNDTSAASKKYVDDTVVNASVGIHEHDIADVRQLQEALDSKASSSHTHTKADITDLETITAGTVGNAIVKRTTDGDIAVPATPNNSFSAASKSYVDTEVGKRASTSHTHTKSQITDLETISTVATVGYLVKRTTSGNIIVPVNPNAETSAASKNYVDNQVGTKANSSHTHTKADITDLGTITTSASSNAIVQRTTTGDITVPTTPTGTLSATSKGYVDTQVGKKANTSHTHTKADITDLETISTTATVDHIVKRASNGNIVVPETPQYTNSAASRTYVDNRTPKINMVTELPSVPHVGDLYFIY